MDEMTIKILALFVGGISLLTGIFMPIMSSIIKRNAKNTDDKLSILYTGQEDTLKAINALELKYNDTKNKTNSNFTAIRESKAECDIKFQTIQGRLNSQSKRGIQNEKDIAILQAIK